MKSFFNFNGIRYDEIKVLTIFWREIMPYLRIKTSQGEFQKVYYSILEKNCIIIQISEGIFNNLEYRKWVLSSQKTPHYIKELFFTFLPSPPGIKYSLVSARYEPQTLPHFLGSSVIWYSSYTPEICSLYNNPIC